MIPELRETLGDWFDRVRWKIFIISERVKKRLGIQTEMEWLRDEFAPLLASSPAFKAGMIELCREMEDLFGQTDKEPPGQ